MRQADAILPQNQAIAYGGSSERQIEKYIYEFVRVIIGRAKGSAECETVFEEFIGKTVKISFFSYMSADKEERYIIGLLLAEDSEFVKIKGRLDGKVFAINKEHIINLSGEKEGGANGQR